MRAPALTLFAAAVLAAAVALGQEPDRAQRSPAEASWTSLDDGLKAGRKSGRPVLVVTTWKPGVCNSCDTWHDRVPKDPAVAAQFPRFERVEWRYDGLGGKVIAWTKEHGGKSEDPSVQAFVVIPESGKVERAGDAETYAPDAFAKWLKERADAFEREHPATRIPFVAAQVADGVCAALDEATRSGRPVLVYVSRGDRADADKAARAQAQSCRALEKGALDSEQAAKALEGWTLLRFELTDPALAAFAKARLATEKAPALLAMVPGTAEPVVVDAGPQADGQTLAAKVRKLSPKR